MNGKCNGTFFWSPSPWGLWGGAKRSNSNKFQLLSQFQIFLNQILCVFSQMKDTKHLDGIFTWSPGLYPGVMLGGQN